MRSRGDDCARERREGGEGGEADERVGEGGLWVSKARCRKW